MSVKILRNKNAIKIESKKPALSSKNSKVQHHRWRVFQENQQNVPQGLRKLLSKYENQNFILTLDICATCLSDNSSMFCFIKNSFNIYFKNETFQSTLGYICLHFCCFSWNTLHLCKYLYNFIYHILREYKMVLYQNWK